MPFLARLRLASLVAVSAITLACASAPSAPSSGSAGSATDAQQAADEDAPPAVSWRARRAAPTQVVAGASPWPPPALALDENMERLPYTSGGLSLFAVVARPQETPRTADTPVEKRPGVVLLHNGFALTNDTLRWSRPFVEAGFVVLLPSYRGENGNPGHFELLRGELDDVLAATRAFAAEEDVDAERLYAFGHSAGGGLVALLALAEEAPFRVLASSNGLYAAATFVRWQRDEPAKVPFDVTRLDERTVRALVPNAHELARPLTVIVGEQDAWAVQHAATVTQRAPQGLVTVHVVPGDHMGSLPHALAKFQEIVVADAFPAPAPRVSAR